MCTGINYNNAGIHLFGRNLDWEVPFPCEVVVTPRHYTFKFRHVPEISSHYAMIGMAMIMNDYPLYFDAINEKGLGMAGLAFSPLCDFQPVAEGKNNVASFEIIQWFLAQCATVEECKKLLVNFNLDNEQFSPYLPTSPLHYIIGDEKEQIVIEVGKELGFRVYDDPWGVLTNAPDFFYMKWNLPYYLNVTGKLVSNRFYDNPVDMPEYSRGMGTIGLPGGTDSVSRFVRAAFTKLNSSADDKIENNISEFFHILQNVAQIQGESEVKPGEYEITQYTSCGDCTNGVYYYTTYHNQTINGVDMFKEDLDGTDLKAYPLILELKPFIQNA